MYGLGISPKLIGDIFGIFKAYCTRVGCGPFPTELNDDTGANLRNIGHEFGSTTGQTTPLRMARSACNEIFNYDQRNYQAFYDQGRCNVGV